MKSEDIMGLIIYLIGTLVMIGIGVAQLKGEEPVGFCSGEKHLRREQLIDVGAWNRRHGMMWLIYGTIIVVSYFIGLIIGTDSILSVVPMCGGFIAPIPVMIIYHHKLIEKYKI